MLTAVFTAAYLIPLGVVALAGPKILQARGAFGLVVAAFAVSVGVGTALAVVGGTYRRADGTGGFELVAIPLVTAFFLALLAAPIAVLLRWRAEGASLGQQTRYALLVGVLIHVPAALIYFFGIGCGLTGECL